MDRYLDMLMRNYPLGSDSSASENDTQLGGAESDDNQNVPTGGFPPIYLCTKGELKKEEETKNREFATKKTAVNIRDIMQQKRRDASE